MMEQALGIPQSAFEPNQSRARTPVRLKVTFAEFLAAVMAFEPSADCRVPTAAVILRFP